MGGVLCRPLRRHRCRDQGRKTWRERPRCARWKSPRACPEGSLTPWLSVSVSVLGIAPPVPTKAVTCAADVVLKSGPLRPDDLVLFVREILITNTHSFRAR